MKQEDIRKQLRKMNTINKEIDAIYNQLAKDHGLSSCAFWLMYSICEEEGQTTQKDLCERWLFSKQTVHSALRGLEQKGYISLVSSKDDRRNKFIVLTKSGNDFAKRHILHVFQIEETAFGHFGSEERALMLSINNKYLINLKEAAEQYKQPEQ